MPSAFTRSALPATLVLAVCLVATAVAQPTTTIKSQQRTVMPWFCLERCGATSDQIKEQLQSIQDHTDIVARAAFEMFNLGPNGTLVDNTLDGSLTPVASILLSYGVQTFPMVSSYPYPPEFLSWMRQLWTSDAGDAFIESCIEAAAIHGFSGYNIDWEPTATPEPEDAANYAAYLDKMGQRFHQANLQLTVDVATWSTLFNWTAIAQTSADTVIIMDTYTNNFTRFGPSLQGGLTQIGVAKLGVGLSTLNLNTNATMSPAEIEERFVLVEKYGVQQVDIWQMPIPDFWWPILQSFLQS